MQNSAANASDLITVSSSDTASYVIQRFRSNFAIFVTKSYVSGFPKPVSDGIFMVKSQKFSLLLSLCLVLTGIFVGLVLTAQMKASVPSRSTYPLDQLESQKSLVKDYNDQQSVLKKEIVSLREEIDTLQTNLETGEEDLKKLKILKEDLGLTEVTGQGIEIILDDSPKSIRENLDINDDTLAHAADLRDIVNVLRLARVDAIAINNQRMLVQTPINCVGNSILVDNFHLLPPFTIWAIGDPDFIIRKLSDPTLLPDIDRRVREDQLQFKFKKKENLIIPVYNGSLQMKYLEPLSSSEI
ncbi:DUF881 domain-containing protein [Candidatus Peregrinibacteria bacterium]|nr:DUF881 domain-containing protein [Candidatus Peregrinibacteria bacterium]